MISIICGLIFLWQFYLGYRRGFFLQSIYTLGHWVAFVLAGFYSRDLAEQLTLWVPYANPEEGASVLFFTQVDLFDLNLVFYRGVAFIVLYLLFYLGVRFLGIFLHAIRWNPLDNSTGKLLAGGLSVWVSTSAMTIFFSLLATVPYTSIQNRLFGDVIAKLLINYNPLSSQLLDYFWVIDVFK